MSHSTNENSKSKVPKIKENAWLFYELRMSTYLGKDVMRCLNEPRPRAMDNLSAQDLEAFNATIPANGRETAATRAWRAARTASINFWDDANVKINRALVESCEDNSTAELICLEADEQENSSAATIWAALQKRFNNKNAVTTTREVGIFNTMYVASGETRGEWIDRLTKQILKIEGRGRRIFEGDRVERLLDGMTANPLYKTEAATLQLLTDNTWDSVTSMLISYDDRDQGNKPGDQANAAITESTIICHGCGEAGHKRFNCPKRTKVPRGGPGGNGGGRGGGGRGSGGKGRGRGSGKKIVECNLCGKRGHYASDCNNAKAFREYLQNKNKKRKGKKQKDKNYDSDSESSCMVQEHANTTTDMATAGVLDSGCSSHTLDARAVPDDVKVDSTQSSDIKTARAGETMSSMGRADAGVLTQSLVLKPGTLNTNLVSLPRLDKSGHIMVLGNSEGLVYKGAKVVVTGGTLVARAPLDPVTNLYQLDNIKQLTQPDHALLGSAPITEDIHLWHRRLGHRSMRSLIKHRNSGRMRGIAAHVKLTAKDKGICDACARAKSTRHRFKSKLPDRTKIIQSTKKPRKEDTYVKSDDIADSEGDDSDSEGGEKETLATSVVKVLTQTKPLRTTIPKICTDIKGPFSTPGLGGQVYYQGFLEADTKFNTAYFSQHKSDAMAHADYHWNTVLKAQGQQATVYQADGAPELISSDVVRLMAKCETRTMWSPPYTAELNSLIERNHQTIFDSGHAMLIHCMLAIIFWCEAVGYASLIYNCFPTTTAYGEMSPIEAKYGVVPDVSRFRVFGCVCYAHVPKERRAKGFVEKAYRGYFMGLDIPTTSFKVWIIDLDEMMTTAHVAFDEVTQIARQVHQKLEYASESRNKQDFQYLVGQVYKDDEDDLLYVTTRVVVQKGVIVTYRGKYVKDKASREESRPIHAADVVKMVIQYQISNAPTVIVDDRPVQIEVRDASEEQPPAKDPAHTEQQPHQRAPTKGGGWTKSMKDDGSPAPLASVQEECIMDTTVNATGNDSLSARATRAAAREARTAIQIGDVEKLTDVVNLVYEGIECTMYMAKLIHSSSEHCLHASDGDNAEDDGDWEESDLAEMQSLVLEHRVWIEAELPPGKKTITTKWVRKTKPSGRRKSRLVGRGFNMVQGVDFNESFAPVAKMATFRIFLTIVAYKSLYTCGLDVKTAYLNSPIDEKVYIEPPRNYVRYLQKLAKRTGDQDEKKAIFRQIKAIRSGHKLQLLKAIYGTKQGGRQWWITIDTYLQSLGFRPNSGDHCFYSLILGDDYVLLLLYVDDVIVAATTTELRDKYVNLIKKKWKITDNGDLKEFLNIKIRHSRSRRQIHMSQEEYIVNFFNQFGFTEDTSVDTPMQENLRLSPEEESDLTDKQIKFVTEFEYQRLIGCLLYLNVCTMPQISYAVSTLSQFNKSPTFLACKAVVRLAKYVYNARKLGLWLGGGRSIVGFYDADWGGDVSTRKSRSGSIIFFGNGPVTWYSKLQTGVAQSTLEAEHTASVPAIQNNTWIRNVVKNANIPGMTYVFATTMYGDNQAAIAISENPMHHQRAKHIHLKYQYVVDQVKKNNVTKVYVKSENNHSDIMTKPVGKNVFKRHIAACTGRGEIEPCIKKLRTLETDSLECPRCSCLLPPADAPMLSRI